MCLSPPGKVVIVITWRKKSWIKSLVLLSGSARNSAVSSSNLLLKSFRIFCRDARNSLWTPRTYSGKNIPTTGTFTLTQLRHWRNPLKKSPKPRLQNNSWSLSSQAWPAAQTRQDSRRKTSPSDGTMPFLQRATSISVLQRRQKAIPIAL